MSSWVLWISILLLGPALVVHADTTVSTTTVTSQDSSVMYEGVPWWQVDGQGMDAGGTHMLSTNPAASVTIKKYFLNVHFWSALYPFNASADISIDGEPIITIGLRDSNSPEMPSSSPATVKSGILFHWGEQVAMEHTITLTMHPGDPFVAFDQFTFDTLVSTPDSPQDPPAVTLATISPDQFPSSTSLPMQSSTDLPFSSPSPTSTSLPSPSVSPSATPNNVPARKPFATLIIITVSVAAAVLVLLVLVVFFVRRRRRSRNFNAARYLDDTGFIRPAARHHINMTDYSSIADSRGHPVPQQTLRVSNPDSQRYPSGSVILSIPPTSRQTQLSARSTLAPPPYREF